jgi:ammonia channel protein AmtB
MMATIATCSIAERTNTDTYIFFSFVTSGFIFPVGLAWCWNDGWLVNLGFIDYGGASIVHIMGGLAGFLGTYLIGPRVGLFSQDDKLSFVLDDLLLDEDANDFELLEKKNEEQKDASRDIYKKNH